MPYPDGDTSKFIFACSSAPASFGILTQIDPTIFAIDPQEKVVLLKTNVSYIGDIFSSFSPLKLIPYAFDVLEILKDYPLHFPFVRSRHSVAEGLLEIEVSLSSQYLHSFSAFRQWI
jgi:hypothetical protein